VDERQPWTIISQKFDGSTHRLWTCAYPLQARPLYKSEDLPHFTLFIPAYAEVIEGGGEVWSSTYDVLACFYAAKHYQVMLLQKSLGNEFYCNSCSIPEINEERREVRFVDLDLDLLVDRLGLTRVVDRIEFALNQKRFGYPAELCARVEQDLEELVRQARLRRGVFAPQYGRYVKQPKG